MGTMSSSSTTLDIVELDQQTREASNINAIDHLAHETATTMIQELANSSRKHDAAASSSSNGARTHTSTAMITNGGEHSAAPNAIFSSIGLGIVNDFRVDSEDATEAAFKALQDAIERGGLGLTVLQNLVLSVRVGVPGRAKQPSLPMHVDVAHLTPLVPPTVSLSRLEVVIGGLMAPESTMDPNAGICTAVACLSFFQQGSTLAGKMMRGELPYPTIAAGTSTAPTTTENVVGETNDNLAILSMVSGGSTTSTATTSKQAGNRTVKAKPSLSLGNASPDSSSRQDYLHQGEPRQRSLSHASLPTHATQHPPVVVPTFHRANSMEMLARISAEIRDQQPLLDKEDPRLSAAAAAAAHNYKKLPPGKTPKNNKRLFVKHAYHDYSTEAPKNGEEYLVRPEAPLRTPNAAFPLKLHETLTIIEQDGLDHVIGWMPHGRSFKIHKQQQFVEEVLPRYFVMTKKSSFLRQLNLYGFNRLSGSGPNQGSYYHEKFLRGLKFLCRRMQRIKVNGNGIRAAGNPDDEPNFNLFPSCPPDPSAPQPQPGLPVSDQEDGNLDVQQNSDAGQNSLPSLQSEGVVESGAGASALAGADNRVHYKPALTQQHSFPLRLQRMLDKLEADGHVEVVSWLPHGRAFMVHDPDRFVTELMPVYFNQTKYSSFQRQLHMYNFCRITTGRDKGAYWNGHFQRGKPSLTVHMPRTRVNGKGTRRPAVPEMEPDLWKDPPLPPIKLGTTVLVPAMPGTPMAARQYASPSSDMDDISDQEEV